MLRIALTLFVLILSPLVALSQKAIPAMSQQKSQPLELWYNQPVKIWEEALPLYKGKLHEWPTTSGKTYHLTLN